MVNLKIAVALGVEVRHVETFGLRFGVEGGFNLTAEGIQDDFNKNKEYYKNLKAFKNKKVFGQIPFVAADVNVDTALADAYYIGKVVYPEKFQDVDPVKKADEIYSFMLKKPVYAEVAKNTFGGFQPVSLEDLEANKFFKEIKKKN